MTKRVQILIGVAVIIATAVIIGIVLLGRHSGTDKVKFGAVLPLTGEIAEYGKRCKAGMDLAVGEINESGGVSGKKLEIVYEDDTGAPKVGVTAMQKLVDIDRVKVVIGAVASSVTLAIEPIATRNKVLLFSPASSSPKLTGISRYFFRDWPSDVFEATALAEFAYNTLKLRKVAILYVNNDYGLGLRGEFERRFKELGGEVAAIDSHEQGATDFRTQLTKIKGSGPQAVYLAGYHREMAFATKQTRELGITAQILGDADYGVQELIEIAGQAAEGAIFSTPEYDPKGGSEPVKTFAKKFKEKYGKEPSVFEANGYDAVKILAKAVQTQNSDTERMSQYIASLSHYPGASGEISFGAKGEVEKPASIKIVKGGRFVLYGNTSTTAP